MNKSELQDKLYEIEYKVYTNGRYSLIESLNERVYHEVLAKIKGKYKITPRKYGVLIESL